MDQGGVFGVDIRCAGNEIHRRQAAVVRIFLRQILIKIDVMAALLMTFLL